MYLPQVYPKPTYFYQSANFVGERANPIFPDWNIGNIHLFGADPATRCRVLSQVKVVSFGRSGVLRGEYVVLLRGLLALDRDGVAIKIGADGDDDWTHMSGHHQVEEYCGSPDFDATRENIVKNWGQIQRIEATSVLFELHAGHNYYHFLTRFLPKMRRFEDSPDTVLAVSQDALSAPYQRELLMNVLGDRKVAVFGDVIRIENPRLAHEPFSRAGFDWVRDRIGLRARKGARRIYIERKSSQSGRNAGRIVESERFCAFLDAHGFERIDFGVGDVPVLEQVKMLDGAGIVLSAHGANLTNIGFLEERANVIEILPLSFAFCSIMQIATAASLNYFGVLCASIDDQRDLIVDMDDLHQAFDEARSMT